MGLYSRRTWLKGVAALGAGAAAGFDLVGCTPAVDNLSPGTSRQAIRVRLLDSVDRVDLAATASPRLVADSGVADGSAGGGGAAEHVLNFPPGTSVPLTLDSSGWRIGTLRLPAEPMTLRPAGDGSVRVNRVAYHGEFRLIPTGNGRFDVVNEVDAEDYLKGVIAKEMYPAWHEQAYRAQAVVARTYALYEAHTAGRGRGWDVWPDQRSQVYGGIDGETDKSRAAVASTGGVVVVDAAASGKIFKAYFSSCCGGVTQAAADAFPGEGYSAVLSEQFNGPRCNASKYYNWGPIAIGRDELTRRVRAWAERRGRQEGRARPEATMAALARIDVAGTNRFGRPTRFVMTDARGTRYGWAAEEMRGAVNADANGGPTIPSSFCKVNAGPSGTPGPAPALTFFDGHGYGHGVGLCQWCAQSRALQGQTYAQIVQQAYPHSRLARAY